MKGFQSYRGLKVSGAGYPPHFQRPHESLGDGLVGLSINPALFVNTFSLAVDNL